MVKPILTSIAMINHKNKHS